MSYNPVLPAGQATMANSAPVVIASNQSSVPVDTELPAAAALADATSNPTVPAVGAMIEVYNGSTWDRLRGDTTSGAFVQSKAAATGGYTVYHLVSAATTNATVVKNSAGKLAGWYIYNSNGSARKVAFHNSSSTPTAGSSVYFSIIIPPLSAANLLDTTGIDFSSGIAITTTTGLADSDTAAVAANDLIINLFYK